MKLEVIISSDDMIKGDKKADFFQNVLRLVFTNEDEYLAFLDNPILKQEDVNNMNESCEEIPVKDLLENASVIIDMANCKEIPIKLLKTKKKITLNVTKLNYKEIASTLSSSYIHDNVVFFDKFNEGYEVSFKDMIMVYKELLFYAKVPLEKSFSPAESFYYIYRLLKNRKYCEEDKNDDKIKSRGLKEVLFGDKIVCVGYSNLFAAISSVLDLPAEVCTWDSALDDDGHASIVVYLNDSKYNLCGIYAIDTTWDSKIDENDIEYENNIRHFLLPMDIEELDKKRNGLKPGFKCSYYKFFIAKIHAEQIPGLKMLSNHAYKKAEIIFNNLGISYDKNMDLASLSEIITKLGTKEISTQVLRNIVANVTPENKNLDKTIKTSVHSKLEEMKINVMLERLLKK